MSKRSHRRKPTPAPQATQVPAWLSRLDTDAFAIGALIVLWALIIPLVNPKGNIPLNDDWCYAKVVFDLLRDHHFHMAGVITMTLIAQALWGLIFCAVLGPSFVALRVSTLVLALGGLLAAYGLLREVKTPRWAAFFGCTVIALDPLYVCLSFCFMTDVPFAAVTLMCLYAYAKAFKKDSIGMIVLGTALACAATLTRQIGVFLPIGFGIAYLVKNGVRAKSVLVAILPAAIVGAILAGYLHWLESAHLLPGYFNIQASRSMRLWNAGPAAWAQATLGVALVSYVYLGLYLLPFLVLTIPRILRALTARQKRANLLVSLTSAVLVIWKLAAERRWVPIDSVTGDYIWNFGIGPATLRDVWRHGIRNVPVMPEGFWIAVTVAGVIGGALLLWNLLAGIEMLAARGRESACAAEKSTLVLLLAVAAMNLAILVPLTALAYFDRYFLSVVPLLIVAVGLIAGPLPKTNRLCVSGALITILLIGAFGIGATHDYLSWNRLRWRAAGELMRVSHVSFRDIDGGPEFNAWYGYDDKAGWWPGGDTYVIAFGPIPGYYVAKSYPYRRWMPPGEGSIVVLRKAL